MSFLLRYLTRTEKLYLKLNYNNLLIYCFALSKTVKLITFEQDVAQCENTKCVLSAMFSFYLTFS